ncbi:MAG: YebC/PmpR family DNA-binding transcriptional regulator, partial [Planctomycetota bacterium]|nr:YebC/PmpR family DNA-binding transcriptional regulator [Planctomycetota bacterium]
TCEVESYSQLSEALEQAEIPVEAKQVTRIPTNVVEVTGDDARKVLKLLEALDEHDDVQNVSANLNIPDDMMAELTESE